MIPLAQKGSLYIRIDFVIPYTGNIWCGKILVNHTGKAIGEEKFGK